MAYKFIDLFAGIGGFRQGFEAVGFECVLSCENDPHAQAIYEANFQEKPFSDIYNLKSKDIPDFDVLLGGFPCQAFSIAGQKKGFDEPRGQLFFEIVRILKDKKPQAFVLENVKHLKDHDRKRTLKIILQTLEDIGYKVSWKILNAKDFGIPQNRERTIIIGSLKSVAFNFNHLQTTPAKSLESILQECQECEYLPAEAYTLLSDIRQQPSGLLFCGYLNKTTRKKGIRDNTLHLSRVHRQPNRIYSSKGVHPTIALQEGAGRYFICHQGQVRKLHISEVAALMGFKSDFKLFGAKQKIYNRLGNSIVVNMVEAIAKEILEQILSNNTKPQTLFDLHPLPLAKHQSIVHFP